MSDFFIDNALRSLWRGGFAVAAIIFVLSTQFLFQGGLYGMWPLPDILLGWLDHFLDLAIVGGCIFVAVAVAASLRVRSSGARHVLLLTSIALGALAGEVLLTVRIPLPPDVSAAAMLFAK